MTSFVARLVAASLVLAGHAVMPAGTAPARAEPAAPSAPGAVSEPLDGGAVMAVVSIRDQRISLYDANLEALRASVSSGMTDYETPVGVYAVLQKKEEHYSNLYDDASMPFMQRITWSGIALHAGALPGRPASHGCVRLPHSFSEQIFPLTRLGMRVVVAYGDVSPVPISHPRLFQPEAVAQARAATPIAYEPSEAGANPFEPDVRKWPARQALLDSLKPDARTKVQQADAAIARAEELKPAQKASAQEQGKAAKAFKRVDAAKRKADERAASAQRWLEQVRAKSKPEKVVKKAEESAQKAAADAAAVSEKLAAPKAALEAADAALARANADLAAAEAAKTAAVDAANEAKRKMLPVSAFVSLKTQRLYVRQGHEAVLDIPITITRPDEPIGTYVYSAVTYEEDGNTARWVAVSTGPRTALDDDYGYAPRKKRKAQAPPPTDLAGAKAALDRIQIPPDVSVKLAKYTWPGSSLIISDEELSKETGQATDFVVLISGEPQGGIKKRPKRPPDDYYYFYDDDDYYEDRRYDPYRRYDRRRPKYTPFFSFW